MVDRRDNRAPKGSNRQASALTHAMRSGAFEGVEWVGSLDVDEFVAVEVGAGRLPDLLAPMGEADAVSLAEALFGSDDRLAYEPGRVTEQFTRRQADDAGGAPMRRGVKTFFRPGPWIAAFRAHRPLIAPDAAPDWRDGSGAPVPEGFAAGEDNGFDAAGRMGLARINHYTTRSAEDFLAKSARGDVVFPNRTLGARYWRTRNADAEADARLTAWPRAALSILKALQDDPKIGPLHRAACAAHAARIAALRGDPAMAELRAVIGLD